MQNGFLQHVYEQPPRCIASLRREPTDRPRPTITLPPRVSLCHACNESAWKQCAFFRIGCPCGNHWAYLLGHYLTVDDPDGVRYFCSPFGLACPDCGTVEEVFDSRQHGFEGEQGVDCNATGQGERERYRCPDCGEVPLELVAGFGYDGRDDLAGEMARRPQDYFDTFMLFGRCQRCDAVLEITWFECK